MYVLSINGGTAETATTSVILSLYGTAAYTMEVSNTSTFVDAAWIPYTTTMPWTLAPDSGNETVYAQFRSVGRTIVGTAQASIDLVPATSSLPIASSSQSSSSSQLSSSTPSSAISSQPSASLPARLKTLQAELAILLAQANAKTLPSATSFAFTRNLYLGTTGNDVKELQQFLVKENAGPAAKKLAAHGTTRNFASLTKAALIEFQKKEGIRPASGYFGPVTRKYVNGIIPF
ncbi:MAG: peptidoglycan-binding domain-containing protein [Nitrospirota bacterium]